LGIRDWQKKVRHGAAIRTAVTSVSEASLVPGFVCSLVFVFLEVSFLAMVQLMCSVTLAFTLTLLVSFVLRIIGPLLLEKWGRYGLNGAGSETDTRHCSQNPVS
jgi:Mg/Co/Ni transporter MgtE